MWSRSTKLHDGQVGRDIRTVAIQHGKTCLKLHAEQRDRLVWRVAGRCNDSIGVLYHTGAWQGKSTSAHPVNVSCANMVHALPCFASATSHASRPGPPHAQESEPPHPTPPVYCLSFPHGKPYHAVKQVAHYGESAKGCAARTRVRIRVRGHTSAVGNVAIPLGTPLSCDYNAQIVGRVAVR